RKSPGRDHDGAEQASGRIHPDPPEQAAEGEADNHEYRYRCVGKDEHDRDPQLVVAVRRLMGMMVIVFIRVSMIVVMTAAAIMTKKVLMAAAEHERTYDIDDQAQSRDRDCFIET